MKKKEIEEMEENTNYYVYKKKSNALYIIIIVILLLFILVSSILLLINSKSKKENQEEFKQENIELKYTDQVATKDEGVYITDVSDVVDKVMPSIVSITSKTVINSGKYGPTFRGSNSSYTAEGAGSGVIINEDENEIYILTNYHVVEDSNELSVKFIDEKSYDAKIKGVSERKDIAVVSVSKSLLDSETLKQIKIATLGNSDELKVGNGIIAIGNALGYGQSVTTGVVSALNREITTDEYTQEMIQIDAAINGGNSGGALLNSKGEVVGINTAKYSSSGSSTSASIEGMGFAIPISNVESIISSLIKGENDSDSITLGIEGYMTNSGAISSYNLPDGFYVSKITVGGNADKSDLEIGNIITEVDGNEVTSIESIRKVLNKKNKGDKITLKVKYPSRNEYKEKEITITLN